MLSKEPSTNSIINPEADFLGRNAESLQRIAIFADLSEGFTIGFAEVNLERDRDFAIAALTARNDVDLQWISLQFTDPDLRYLIASVSEALSQVEIVPDRKIILLISGLEQAIGGYGNYPPLLSNLNIARDTYTHRLPYPMLFFLPGYAITRFARFAPDFWAWKSMEVRLKNDLPTPERAVAEMIRIPNDQKVIPVSQDRFDLLYRLLTEYPQPTLTRADLLEQLGAAYESHANYVNAETAYQESLKLYQKLVGDNDLEVANSLNNLAEIYRLMGRFSEAEPLLKRALQIWETQSRADHPDIASGLNNLALLYYEMGHFSDAEPLFDRSLQIWKTQLVADLSDTATTLSNLALLYYDLGRYSEAEPLLKRVLQIRETQLGTDHPDTATNLNNLAGLYSSMRRYNEAEPLFRRSLQIWETQLGGDHPNISISLNNLAGLYKSMGRYSEAESLFERSLQISETQLGADHPHTAQSLNNLAELYKSMGRYSEVEPLYLRALEISIQSLGANHPNTQTVFGNFCYFLQQALTNNSTASLSDHPLTQQLLQEMK